MYAGRIVERGKTDDVFADPKHPYTKGLINSVPRLDIESSTRLTSIPGQPPNVINLPDCCPFFPRCEYTKDICRNKYPGATELGNGRVVNCWLYAEEKKMIDKDTLLEVRNLKMHFPFSEGAFWNRTQGNIYVG